MSSHAPNLTRDLTIRDLVWRQCVQAGPSQLDAPLFDPITVSNSVVVVRINNLHDFIAGF